MNLTTYILTNLIYIDIMNGTCLLPKVEDTSHMHNQSFDIKNRTIGLPEGDNCPIT